MIEPSEKFVRHIQELSKEKTGEEMSHQEAWEGACNLIGFFDLLLRIDRRIKNAKRGKSKRNAE
jgi:hypothetical protein